MPDDELALFFLEPGAESFPVEDLEGGGGVFGGGLGVELAVPLSAELGTPEAGVTVAALARADGEIGKFADREAAVRWSRS